MWLFTQHGMISAVQHRSEPGTLLVRARTREHLARLLDGLIMTDFAIPEIKQTPEADYEFRVELSKNAFAAMMLDAIGELNYPNFKGQCDNGHDRTYARMLHSVWQVVYDALGKNSPRYGPVSRERRPKRKDDRTLATYDDRPARVPQDGSRHSFLDSFR